MGGGAKPRSEGRQPLGPSKKLALAAEALLPPLLAPRLLPALLTHQTARARPARTADARRRRPWGAGTVVLREAVEREWGRRTTSGGTPAEKAATAEAATLCHSAAAIHARPGTGEAGRRKGRPGAVGETTAPACRRARGCRQACPPKLGPMPPSLPAWRWEWVVFERTLVGAWVGRQGRSWQAGHASEDTAGLALSTLRFFVRPNPPRHLLPPDTRVPAFQGVQAPACAAPWTRPRARPTGGRG